MAEFDIDKLSIEVSAKADQAAQSIERLAKAFDDFQKRNQGASKSATILKNFNKQAEQMDSPSDSLAKSLLKKGTEVYALTKIGRAMGRIVVDSFNEAIGFTENRNLFYVTMGKYASAAEEYAETVSDTLGTNVSDWLRYQGVINDMTKSFGMAEDQAYQMSKTLTQLMYDYSSYYNMTVTEAYEKINAGIAGEIEPMRRLGKDLSKAKLEAIALEHGITKAFNSMTQSEKAQLRFIAIMEQSTDVMGDMARTIDDPANALRVLDARWTAFTRSLGNLFIPVVKNTLPYLQAGAMILKDWADSIAEFFGIEPETVEFESTAKNLSSASESVSEIKRNLLGIDEINKLGNTDESSAVGGDLGIDLSQWDYDFLGDANQKAIEIAENLKPVATALGLVGLAFGATKLVMGGADLLKNFNSLGTSATKLTKALGAGMLVGGILGTSAAMADAVENGWSFGNVLGGIVGVGMGVAGGAMIGGPVGALIGGLAAVTGGLITFGNTTIRIKKEAKLAEFFKVEGQAFSETENYFKSFLDTLQSDKMADALKVVADANSEFESAQSNVNGILTNLQGDRDNISLVEDLADAFESLGDAAKKLNTANIGTAFQSIADSLSGEFSTIVGQIEGLPQILAELEAKGEQNANNLQTRYQKLIAEAKTTGWTEALTKEAADIQLEYQKLVGMQTNSALSNFQTQASVLGSKINAGSSLEEIQSNITTLKGHFTTFEEQMLEEMSGTTTVFDNLIRQALNNGDENAARSLTQYKSVLLAEYNNRLFQGQEEYNKILKDITSTYLFNDENMDLLLKWRSLDDVGGELQEKLMNETIEQFLGGKWSDSNISGYADSYVSSLLPWETEQIGEMRAMEDLLLFFNDEVIGKMEDGYSQVTSESISSVNSSIADMTAVEIESLTEVRSIVDLMTEVVDIMRNRNTMGTTRIDGVITNKYGNSFGYATLQ